MHAHYLTRACAWELEDRVAAYRELRAETRKSQLLIASVTREERLSAVGILVCITVAAGGENEFTPPGPLLPLANVAACKGSWTSAAPAVTLSSWPVRQALRDLWLSPRRSKPTAQLRLKPSLPLIVLSIINLRTALNGIAVRSQPSGGLRGRRGKPPQTRRGGYWVVVDFRRSGEP
jgi:hypothetical protein